MSLGADILLKIRSTFESKPVEDAKTKTEELGKTTEKAGNEAADGMNVMAAATAAMQGNVNATIGAIAPLIEKLKVMKVSLTQLTLVGALLGALVALFKSIRDRAAAAVETLEGFKAESFEKQVARIEAAHAKWDTANKKSLAIREAAHQFFLAENDAYKQEAIAIAELAKQRELANAASEDERKIIENKYKSRVEDITGAFDSRSGEQEKKRLEQKARDDEERIRKNEEAIAKKLELGRKRFQDAGGYTQAANEASQGWGGINMQGGESQADRLVKMADKARADYERARKDAEALKAENDQLRISADQSSKMAAIQEVRNRTRGVVQEASSTATGREASDIQRDIDRREQEKVVQSQIDRKEKDQAAAEERFKELSDRAARNRDIQTREAGEAGKVYASYRAKGDKRGEESALVELNREKQEAQQASEALDAIVREAAATIRGIREQADELKEQMKRIGQ